MNATLDPTPARALHDNPGQTAAELADMIGADAEKLRAQLSLLALAGKAHIGGFTRCRVTGSVACTWQPGRHPDARGPLVLCGPRQMALVLA